MAYVALKPCSFAGHKFKIGDNVPLEVLQPGSIKNLLKMGLIVDPGKEEAKPAPGTIMEPVSATIELTVPVEEGDLALDVTKDGIQAIINVLTSKAEDAEKIIKEMTDGDALILLHIVDSRKTIKAAAEERAEAITAGEGTEEGEQ